MGNGFGGAVRSATDEVPSLHLALALDRDRPPRLAHELVLEQLFVARVIWIRPEVPWDSMRLAVFTASPQRSYRNRFRPITPATTGPELIPTRNPSPRCPTSSSERIAACMSSAIMASA